MFDIDTAGRRRFLAPVNGTQITTGQIEVWLNPNEKIEWIWITYPDGTRHVTGYNITKL